MISNRTTLPMMILYLFVALMAVGITPTLASSSQPSPSIPSTIQQCKMNHPHCVNENNVLKLKPSSSTTKTKAKTTKRSSGHHSAVTVRGGDDYLEGTALRPNEKSTATAADDENETAAEGDYEYEYEYIEVDDENDEEENYSVDEDYQENGNDKDGDEEYEYYQEEEEEDGKEIETDASSNVESAPQEDVDLGGELFVEKTATTIEDDTADDDNNNNGDSLVIVDSSTDDNNGDVSAITTDNEKRKIVRTTSFWGRGNRNNNVDVTNQGEEGTDYELGTMNYPNDEVLDASEEEEGGEYNMQQEDDDDEEDYLFSTPIPSKTPQKLQLVAKKEVSVNDNDNGVDDEFEAEDDYDDYEEQYEYGGEGGNRRKAPRASRANNQQQQPWWQYNQSQKKGAKSGGQRSSSKNKSTKKNRQRQQQQWRPTSSTMAGFVAPLSANRSSFSIRSHNGRPFYTTWLSSISTVIGSIIQPIGGFFQTVTHGITSTLSNCLSGSWLVICNSFDFLWYGPVDGVTTTGIAMREGGLRAILFSSPITAALSSIVIMSLVTIMVQRVWRDMSGMDVGWWQRRSNNRESRGYNLLADEEYDEDDISEEDPPTVEEELEFLNRNFDAANPSSTERITKTISTKQDRFWQRHNGSSSADSPKSRKGQRQFTIKSIQTWWKERPKQQAIAIIEPQHLRNQKQPQSQEIKKLQKQHGQSQEIKKLHKQLSVSEQERAILQQDVQRLQHKLQRAQHDARSVTSQNKWLERQTSKADQILTKAVEVERRKANEEMGRVRESMQGVLERERMLMRARDSAPKQQPQRTDYTNVGGQNDLDMAKAPQTRRLDGVKIAREVDQVDDEEDGADRSWRAM